MKMGDWHLRAEAKGACSTPTLSYRTAPQIESVDSAAVGKGL